MPRDMQSRGYGRKVPTGPRQRALPPPRRGPSNVGRAVVRGARQVHQQQRNQARARLVRTRFALGQEGPHGPRLAGRTGHQMYGPEGLVDQVLYLDHAQRLWKKVAHFYGRKPTDPAPKMYFRHLGRMTLGVTYMDKGPGKRSVAFDPVVAEEAVLRPEYRRYSNTSYARYARLVPVHEWAHVFQSLHASGHLRAEGGAEALTQDVARRVGTRQPQIANSYLPLVHRIRRRLGKEYVRRGQFR